MINPIPINLRQLFSVSWLLILLVTILIACGASETPTPTSVNEPVEEEDTTATSPSEAVSSTPTSEAVTIDLETVPQVDTSEHIVPLEEIYFDTFRRTNRVVPLDEASEELITSLRDAIPPIYNPKFVPASEADVWLDSKDIVLGYADGDEAYAYPIKIMNWHEMVSHEINGQPILATY